MSANDILDVLNIQRDEQAQPQKKKQRTEQPVLQKGAMARELYNLLGPNTPPVSMNMGNNRIRDRKQRVSPWTRMLFVPNKSNAHAPKLYHWEKGTRELLLAGEDKVYFFDKFSMSIDIPDLVDEPTYAKYMTEIKEQEARSAKERKERKEREEQTKRDREAAEKATKDSASAVKKEGGADKVSELLQSASAKEHASIEKKAESEVTETAKEWTYEETKILFRFCKDFELKWHIVNDRYPAKYGRTMEDLKEQFYRICFKILKENGTGNPNLLDSLGAFLKTAETDRKQYLESLLKRTPAEIAEEESLVIEARRFELAAKKMLMERASLLTLLDSPQSSQSVQQYQSSQGLTNLYNNLMILDKHQKKKLQQKAAQAPADPVPPSIPLAASSSHKRDRAFQTHLQQYLSGVLKQQGGPQTKGEPSPIQLLLAKRLTAKEEEAYGLFYHENERLTPNVILRSTQKLSGLQQRQSVFKAVNGMLQELGIPTGGGTTWKPNMPTRKTMAKYDEMIKAVVALLEVKRGKDKLEAEIELIKSQRGLE